jgi:hypothetical protein
MEKTDYLKPFKNGTRFTKINEIRESGKSIIRKKDNACIPCDIKNRDYQEFLEVEFEKPLKDIILDKTIEI